MDDVPKIFEIIMLLCFGSSWPFAVTKTLRTKIVRGKSPVFLALILTGYLAGILNKLLINFDYVIWLYCLNGSMVLTAIILYVKYEKPDWVRQKRAKSALISIFQQRYQMPHRRIAKLTAVSGPSIRPYR